jgi:hypothetical protein
MDGSLWQSKLWSSTEKATYYTRNDNDKQLLIRHIRGSPLLAAPPARPLRTGGQVMCVTAAEQASPEVAHLLLVSIRLWM